MVWALLSVLCGVVVQAGTASPARPSAPLSSFIGEWQNVDADTRGVPRLVISQKDKGVSLRVGSAPPVAGEIFSRAPDTAPAQATVIITASAGGRTFIIRPAGDGQLLLEMLTRFADDSGRSDYYHADKFRKANPK